MPKKPKRGRINFSAWLKNSVWSFPVILGIILLGLTAFRISGTSVGVYNRVLYGQTAPDPNLLFNHAQPIRSDEWLGVTQLTVSQSKNGYPMFNHDLGSGRNVALQAEVPYKDWSMLFKPQNWSFFILPLEFAFALKWWLLLYTLIISCYFFALRMLRNKKLPAILLGMALGLSPFILWWWQTSIFACIAYGFLALILGTRIIDQEKFRWIKSERLSDVLHVLALAFVASCFGLILYPPFQIPIALVVVSYLVGHIVNRRFHDNIDFRQLAKRFGILCISAVLAGIVGAAFVITKHGVIQSLTQTVYPGSRVVYSGDLRLLSVFDGFLMPLLQSGARSAHFFSNQSESSNFILLMPFLLIPGFVLMVFEHRKYRRIDWTFFAIQMISVLFLVRAYVPHGSILFKPLLLNKVPNVRLLIAMGFAGFIQLMIIARKLSEFRLTTKKLLPYAFLYGLSCFIVLLWVGSYSIQHYPQFLNSYLLMSILAAGFTLIIILLLSNKLTLALVVLVVFSLGSSFRIVPLYQGLGIVNNSEIIRHMQADSGPDDNWATVDNIYFENFGVLAGRKSITGLQIYPDLEFWRQIGGSANDFVYNREGHAIFSTDPALDKDIKLVQNNLYQIKFTCNAFLKNNVDYVLATHALNNACVTQVDTVSYPKLTFYIYKINK